MPAPFAALESRVNASVFAHLANATADFAGTAVEGIFDAEYLPAIGVESTSPAFTCSIADLPSGYRTATVTIRSIDYVITGDQPDGTGITVLLLDKA